ncbi:hypothetical protein ACVIIW_003941 [Bradyrhizobium sp. USDA 4449]
MTRLIQPEINENPVWLLEPPTPADITPPVDTHAQELPFSELTWQNFERLCHRLAKSEGDVEYCCLYGTQGQEQGGIDIYVRRTSTTKYGAWQSKRHESFGPAQIEKAVKDFLESSWAAKSDLFVLCVKAGLRSTNAQDKIEACASQLRERGIEFRPLDGEQISLQLKSRPEIVYDFFGYAWTERFCGRPAAQAVANRLTPSEFHALKSKLLACYASHFASIDPGVLSLLNAPPGGKRHLQLPDRFIAPDLMLQAEIFADVAPALQPRPASRTDWASTEHTGKPPATLTVEAPRREKTRVAADNWVSAARHDIVLGLAGAGKSTLLRFIALDMLAHSARFDALRRRFPDFLPVWVSFAFWTKLIASDRERCSLVDAIETWFRRQDEPSLIELVRKAYDDKRLLLLVDGIDEWDNETAANTAFGLLQSFTERNAVPAIMTSRPHGFRLITGLDGSWRISEIAPFSPGQQTALATTWFGHLNRDNDEADARNKANAQAVAFVEELQRNGALAQLAATPLLLTGLIALKQAHLQLPRNRFVAYGELTKLLLELHPVARDKAALASVPRHALDPPTRELALAALAYAIHSGRDGASPDAISIDQAVDVIGRCLTERIGTPTADANQFARALLAFGEEDVGILVKKSSREVGFFHRVFQEHLSATHLASFDFDQQQKVVETRAADPRWREVILCLLHKLQRPSEIDGLLATIENADGDISVTASRDILLAEATFGEFRKTPQLTARLANKAFQQIELGRWPSVRLELVGQAIEGASSASLGPKISEKLSGWFPRWSSYGLEQAFAAMESWPDDPLIEPVLWRGLHDEFFGAAQAAARTLAKRYKDDPELADRLFLLAATPPSIGAIAAALEALWRGWPKHPKTESVLRAAAASESPLVALMAVRGIVALGSHGDSDFELLTTIAGRDDYTLTALLEDALIAGWSGTEKLRDFAMRETDAERGRFLRRHRPDFGLLINGFPGERWVAELVAQDLLKEHPHFLFEREDLHHLAAHFRGDTIVVPALEGWALKYRPDDAYTLSRAARVAPTPAMKAALLRCVTQGHLAFWAASALIDLWGAQDAEVREALNHAANQPVERLQDIAHALPFVMDDKKLCRKLLLDVVSADSKRFRADFALQGLRLLGLDETDQEAIDTVIKRGYDKDRFVVENEVREVIGTFYGDPRVIALAKRELQRESGAIGTVAKVFAGDSSMRSLVLHAAAPLDLNMRSHIADALSKRATSDLQSRDLLSFGCREEAGDIVLECSIKVAKIRKETSNVEPEYIDGIREELDAIGPRMDTRRQAALSSLIVLGRLDLVDFENFSGVRGLGSRKHRSMLRLVATEWASIREALGGNEAALNALGVERKQFFEVFANDIDSSKAMTEYALSVIEESANAVPASAIRLVERVRPNSGLLRDICLRGLSYNGSSNLDSFLTTMTAGEVLGRSFSLDRGLEDQLTKMLDRNPRDTGAIMALCEGWPASTALPALRSRLQGQPQLPIPVMFKLMSTISPEEIFVGALGWAAENLEGDLWESPAHWIPPTVRRLKQDNAACERMRNIVFDRPSPGVEASFPRLLVRANGLTDDLRTWCHSKTLPSDEILVGEVGFDLVAGQLRLVAHSLFDILSGQDL